MLRRVAPHEHPCVHVAEMVPTAGLEPAQVAPLAPQTSASTNFATSACLFMRFAQTFNGVEATPTLNYAALRADKKSLSRNKLYFSGAAGAAGAGVGAAGLGAAGLGAVGAGAGVLSTDRSSTLVGSPGDRVPR
jgi:hypothetical protein